MGAMRMLELNDPRWTKLEGGYRKPIDLPALVRDVRTSDGSPRSWAALWQEVYHQGDVGVGSYAVVPHLVRIHRERGVVDWNTYALTASIEAARGRRKNPPIPEWVREGYDAALGELAAIGLKELPLAQNQETGRSILAVLAIVHGASVYSRFLIEFSEEEAAELIAEMLGD
jgi:hypothetical protein